MNVPVRSSTELSTGKTWLVMKGPPTALAVSDPAIVVEPVTNVLLALFGETWTRYDAALWNKRLPDTIRAPTALSPGARVPPELIVVDATRPVTVPVPASVAPEFTVTPLDPAIEPETRNVPAATVVAPA